MLEVRVRRRRRRVSDILVPPRPSPPTQTLRLWLGLPVVQELTAYTDRSFTFKLSTPQTTWMLKRCAGVEKVRPNSGFVHLQSA